MNLRLPSTPALTTRKLALIGLLVVVIAAVLFATGIGQELLIRADKGPGVQPANAAVAAIRTAPSGPPDYSGLVKIGALVVAMTALIGAWARIAPSHPGRE